VGPVEIEGVERLQLSQCQDSRDFFEITDLADSPIAFLPEPGVVDDQSSRQMVVEDYNAHVRLVVDDIQ